MVDMVEVFASEATKWAVSAATSELGKGARRLYDLLRSRKDELSEAPDIHAVLELARRDPGFREELIQAVGLLNADSVARDAPQPIPAFRNHRRYLENPPLDGPKLIAGPHGCGATELARQLGAAVADRFPNGRVEVDLARFRSGDVLDLAGVMQYVLRRFGVDAGELAVDDARLAEQLASALATRQCVIILDNVTAASEIEVFTRFRTSLLLITTTYLSRDLRSLDRNPILLRGLDPEGARELLADYCGAVRPAEEPEASSELVALCEGLPEALREVGLSLATRAGEPQPVAGLLAAYRQTGVVDAEGVIRESVRRTIDALDARTARAVALLAEFPGGRFTRETATAYLGAGTDFEAVLAAQLTTPDGNAHRVRRLVGEYLPKPPEGERAAVFAALLRHVRDNAVAADFQPDRLRVYEDAGVEAWSRPEDRFDWLDEHLGLIGALAREGCERGHYREVCQLGGAVEILINQRWRWREYADIADCVVRAALTDPEQRAAQIARAYSMRAKAYYLARVFEPAQADLEQASRHAEAAAQPRLSASVAEFRSRYWEERFDAGWARDLDEAIRWMRAAVAIDRQLGDRTALGIHLRMLAVMLVKAGYATEALTQAGEAARYAEGRNLGRAHMAATRAYLALGDTVAARTWLGEADRLLRGVGAEQYGWELRELEARLLVAEGAIDAARQTWGSLLDEANRSTHPRRDDYFTELCSLPAPSARRWLWPW
ncbi:NB-ARC domain-containing protein [Sciscionella sediminilitoris]|uniref:NB-ARC domain-containing protein n=1 Tax=Sciscionella sediminilitoris TaxID=1445613 RepID=UPI0004DF98E0|nr:NB-ARC domain-containing protein [Sciscionella sp. SE31]